MEKIFTNNLARRIEQYDDLYRTAVLRVIKSGHFILGNEVINFEKEFGKYLNIKFCYGVANGTDALYLALASLNLKKNDLIGLAANAGMYATLASQSLGLRPYFIDVELKTNNINYDSAAKAIKCGIKALIVTHLYGLAVSEIGEIASLCRKNGVWLIEDCAQAHGAEINSMKVGSFGDISCFSFYPTKNLGAIGDAGAVVTNNKLLANKLVKLRQYGWKKKYVVQIGGGINSRLDEIQAAVLREFLPQLNSDNEKRRRIAAFYKQNINNSKVICPPSIGKDYVAHLYVIQAEKRNQLKLFLAKNNVFTDIHYPIPDHKQPIFKDTFNKQKLINTELLSKKNLTLPCYPEMKISEAKLIVNLINHKIWK